VCSQLNRALASRSCSTCAGQSGFRTGFPTSPAPPDRHVQTGIDELKTSSKLRVKCKYWGFDQNPTTWLESHRGRQAAHKCNCQTLTVFANGPGHHADLPPGPTWIEVLLANPQPGLLFLECGFMDSIQSRRQRRE
jgi:hypothetical protein